MTIEEEIRKSAYYFQLTEERTIMNGNYKPYEVYNRGPEDYISLFEEVVEGSLDQYLKGGYVLDAFAPPSVIRGLRKDDIIKGGVSIGLADPRLNPQQIAEDNQLRVFHLCANIFNFKEAGKLLSKLMKKTGINTFNAAFVVPDYSWIYFKNNPWSQLPEVCATVPFEYQKDVTEFVREFMSSKATIFIQLPNTESMYEMKSLYPNSKTGANTQMRIDL